VRAELNISHKPGDLAGLLTQLYGAHDAAALAGSALADKAPKTAKSISYAARTHGLIVMAEFVGNRVVVYVESSGGRLRAGAVEVWGDIRDGTKPLRPKLKRLILLDEDANDEIATAAAGVAASLRREDLFVPIATGIVTALVLAAVSKYGHASSDFLYGSLPALGVAILSLGRLVSRSLSKEPKWR
jgi:hypothetical protein